jgi:hypothetical protein
VCEVQARVDYDIARSELRARYRPTASNMDKARRDRADAGLARDQARCGDLAGGAKKVCLDEARAKWAGARSEAHAAAGDSR